MEQKIVKINELLLDKAFIAELEKAENNAQVRDLFIAHGVADMTVEDVEAMLQESARIHQNEELGETDLDQVAGGILLTASSVALFCIAGAELGFFSAYGYRTIKSWIK